MKLRGRFVGVALAGVVAGLAACGGDSTGVGPTAASVTGVAGDNQSAPTGATLSFPLSFIALNSSGQPARGVHVTWSVSPAGGVSFNPATETTDASGAASTTVTAGLAVGNIAISAAVTGISNVVYHATIVDPCSYLAPLAVGETVNGALARGDCSDGVRSFDFYGLSLPSGQQNIRISMHAGANDTYLLLWSAISPFPFIAFNDDSILTRAGARNSQIDIVLPSGNYIVGATSFDPFDSFLYSVAPTLRSTSMSGCREVWVMKGVSATDDISTTDCRDSSATPHYYDVARIFVDSGQVLSVSEQSTAMNPLLTLYTLIDTLAADTTNPSYVRQFVKSNDDSSTNTNAFIRFSTDTSNYYDIIIGTSTGGATGAYTLSVDVTAAPSPPFRTPASGWREWWRANPGALLPRSRGLRGHKL